MPRLQAIPLSHTISIYISVLNLDSVCKLCSVLMLLLLYYYLILQFINYKYTILLIIHSLIYYLLNISLYHITTIVSYIESYYTIHLISYRIISSHLISYHIIIYHIIYYMIHLTYPISVLFFLKITKDVPFLERATEHKRVEGRIG